MAKKKASTEKKSNWKVTSASNEYSSVAKGETKSWGDLFGWIKNLFGKKKK